MNISNWIWVFVIWIFHLKKYCSSDSIHSGLYAMQRVPINGSSTVSENNGNFKWIRISDVHTLRTPSTFVSQLKSHLTVLSRPELKRITPLGREYPALSSQNKSIEIKGNSSKIPADVEWVPLDSHDIESFPKTFNLANISSLTTPHTITNNSNVTVTVTSTVNKFPLSKAFLEHRKNISLHLAKNNSHNITRLNETTDFNSFHSASPILQGSSATFVKKTLIPKFKSVDTSASTSRYRNSLSKLLASQAFFSRFSSVSDLEERTSPLFEVGRTTTWPSISSVKSPIWWNRETIDRSFNKHRDGFLNDRFETSSSEKITASPLVPKWMEKTTMTSKEISKPLVPISLSERLSLMNRFNGKQPLTRRPLISTIEINRLGTKNRLTTTEKSKHTWYHSSESSDEQNKVTLATKSFDSIRDVKISNHTKQTNKTKIWIPISITAPPLKKDQLSLTQNGFNSFYTTTGSSLSNSSSLSVTKAGLNTNSLNGVSTTIPIYPKINSSQADTISKWKDSSEDGSSLDSLVQGLLKNEDLKETVAPSVSVHKDFIKKTTFSYQPLANPTPYSQPIRNRKPTKPYYSATTYKVTAHPVLVSAEGSTIKHNIFGNSHRFKHTTLPTYIQSIDDPSYYDDDEWTTPSNKISYAAQNTLENSDSDNDNYNNKEWNSFSVSTKPNVVSYESDNNASPNDKSNHLNKYNYNFPITLASTYLNKPLLIKTTSHPVVHGIYQQHNSNTLNSFQSGNHHNVYGSSHLGTTVKPSINYNSEALLSDPNTHFSDYLNSQNPFNEENFPPFDPHHGHSALTNPHYHGTSGGLQSNPYHEHTQTISPIQLQSIINYLSSYGYVISGNQTITGIGEEVDESDEDESTEVTGSTGSSGSNEQLKRLLLAIGMSIIPTATIAIIVGFPSLIMGRKRRDTDFDIPVEALLNRINFAIKKYVDSLDVDRLTDDMGIAIQDYCQNSIKSSQFPFANSSTTSSARKQDSRYARKWNAIFNHVKTFVPKLKLQLIPKQNDFETPKRQKEKIKQGIVYIPISKAEYLWGKNMATTNKREGNGLKRLFRVKQQLAAPKDSYYNFSTSETLLNKNTEELICKKLLNLLEQDLEEVNFDLNDQQSSSEYKSKDFISDIEETAINRPAVVHLASFTLPEGLKMLNSNKSNEPFRHSSDMSPETLPAYNSLSKAISVNDKTLELNAATLNRQMNLDFQNNLRVKSDGRKTESSIKRQDLLNRLFNSHQRAKGSNFTNTDSNNQMKAIVGGNIKQNMTPLVMVMVLKNQSVSDNGQILHTADSIFDSDIKFVNSQSEMNSGVHRDKDGSNVVDDKFRFPSNRMTYKENIADSTRSNLLTSKTTMSLLDLTDDWEGLTNVNVLSRKRTTPQSPVSDEESTSPYYSQRIAKLLKKFPQMAPNVMLRSSKKQRQTRDVTNLFVDRKERNSTDSFVNLRNDKKFKAKSIYDFFPLKNKISFKNKLAQVFNQSNLPEETNSKQISKANLRSNITLKKPGFKLLQSGRQKQQSRFSLPFISEDFQEGKLYIYHVLMSPKQSNFKPYFDSSTIKSTVNLPLDATVPPDVVSTDILTEDSVTSPPSIRTTVKTASKSTLPPVTTLVSAQLPKLSLLNESVSSIGQTIKDGRIINHEYLHPNMGLKYLTSPVVRIPIPVEDSTSDYIQVVRDPAQWHYLPLPLIAPQSSLPVNYNPFHGHLVPPVVPISNYGYSTNISKLPYIPDTTTEKTSSSKNVTTNANISRSEPPLIASNSIPSHSVNSSSMTGPTTINIYTIHGLNNKLLQLLLKKVVQTKNGYVSDVQNESGEQPSTYEDYYDEPPFVATTYRPIPNVSNRPQVLSAIRSTTPRQTLIQNITMAPTSGPQLLPVTTNVLTKPVLSRPRPGIRPGLTDCDDCTPSQVPSTRRPQIKKTTPTSISFLDLLNQKLGIKNHGGLIPLIELGNSNIPLGDPWGAQAWPGDKRALKSKTLAKRKKSRRKHIIQKTVSNQENKNKSENNIN